MKKVNLEYYNNSHYEAGASYWKRVLWYFINVIIFINPLFPFTSIKPMVLKLFGAKIKGKVLIKPRVNIKYPWFLEVGGNTSIGEGVWIDNLCKVKIGESVCISQNACLLTGNHNYKKTTFDLLLGDIVINNGVWVGAHSTVCSGITCGEHSVLTVGSIATKDLQPYGIYQGNPATFKKMREIN